MEYYKKGICIDCGKECCTGSERCRKCQNIRHSKTMSGKNNPFYGKHHTEESITKNRVAHIVHGESIKKHYCKISNCNNGISYQNYRDGLGFCKSCSKIGKLNGMCGISGEQSPTFGRVCLPPPKDSYNGILMRSRWETSYAKYLDNNNVDWLYEATVFHLGDSTYTPDFYIPSLDKYIEIKGQFSEYAKNKISKFKRIYPNTNYEILMLKQLKELGVL